MIKEQPTYSNWLDQWIFGSFPMQAEALGLYRIVFALFLLIWGLPNFEWIAGSPSSFFNPPTYSFANLLSDFPPYWFLQGLSLLVVVLAIMLLFGWHTRWVSIALCLAIVAGKSFSFSFGLIGQDMIVWLVPLFMSFSNWGSTYSIDARRNTEPPVSTTSWPVTMMALLLGFGMFSAGLPKLLGGWLDISTQATRGHFFTQYYVIGGLHLLSSWAVNITNTFLWEVMDWGAVWFELLFLAAVIRPQWFRWWLVLAVVFHSITFLVFNISFHFQYIVYLLFIDWGKVSQPFYQRLAIITQKLFKPAWLLVAIAIYLPLYIWAQQVVSMPALLAPSVFYLPAEWLGWDYKIVMGISALLPAFAIVIWQLISSPLKSGGNS